VWGPKGQRGSSREISWDEVGLDESRAALSRQIVAETTAAEGRSHAVLVFRHASACLQQLQHGLTASSYRLGGSLLERTKSARRRPFEGQSLQRMGSYYGTDPGAVPERRGPDHILLGDQKPGHLQPAHDALSFKEAQDRGATLVVIDPRAHAQRPRRARLAPSRPLPGLRTSGCLGALGLMHVIIAEGLHDEGVCAGATHARLRRVWRERRAGRVPAQPASGPKLDRQFAPEEIVRLARLYRRHEAGRHPPCNNGNAAATPNGGCWSARRHLPPRADRLLARRGGAGSLMSTKRARSASTWRGAPAPPTCSARRPAPAA